MDSGLTSWAASEDQLTDFIIDKDEQGVGEGAEPPVGPGKHKHTRKKKKGGMRKGSSAPAWSRHDPRQMYDVQHQNSLRLS